MRTSTRVCWLSCTPWWQSILTGTYPSLARSWVPWWTNGMVNGVFLSPNLMSLLFLHLTSFWGPCLVSFRWSLHLQKSILSRSLKTTWWSTWRRATTVMMTRSKSMILGEVLCSPWCWTCSYNHWQSGEDYSIEPADTKRQVIGCLFSLGL